MENDIILTVIRAWMHCTCNSQLNARVCVCSECKPILLHYTHFYYFVLRLFYLNNLLMQYIYMSNHITQYGFHFFFYITFVRFKVFFHSRLLFNYLFLPQLIIQCENKIYFWFLFSFEIQFLLSTSSTFYIKSSERKMNQFKWNVWGKWIEIHLL